MFPEEKYEFWYQQAERAEAELEEAIFEMGIIAVTGQLPLFVSYRSSFEYIDVID